MLKVRSVNHWWYRLRVPTLTPHLRAQHHQLVARFFQEIRRTSWRSQTVETLQRCGFLEEDWERTALHHNRGRFWDYADSMSRNNSISKPHNIPTERMDSFKYEIRHSLGCETLSSRRTLLHRYHDRIIVSRPNSFMGSHCEWYQQIRHRNVRRNTHWERLSVHQHRETCRKGQAKTKTCCKFVFQFLSMKENG